MDANLNAHSAAAPSLVLAKWHDPSDEALGTARLAAALVERGLAGAREVAIAAPNANWAVQMHRACEQVGQKSALCLPVARLDDAARASMAVLALLARPDDQQARAAYVRAGHTDAQADELACTYSDARGFTLVRAAGLPGQRAFSHALLHVTGDETAAQLHDLVATQLRDPTLPANTQAVVVTGIPQLACGLFAHVFVVGCVDGMVPGPDVYSGHDADRKGAAERAKQQFYEALGAARVRTVASYFASAEKSLADAARIRYARTRADGDASYAVCRPSPFFAEMGHDRPTTTGGQALLSAFGLTKAK